MKRSTGKQLKRLAAIALAAGMMAGSVMTSQAEVATPSFAGETKSIDSADQTMDQDAVVWATVTNQPLKQLKVTLPIRLDFVVYKDLGGGGGSTDTVFLCGEYEIRVDASSEVGVTLDKVKVTKPTGSKWNLVTAAQAAAESADFHKVSISLGEKELKVGETAIDNFDVGVGSSRALGMAGVVGTRTNVTGPAAAERAFQVTYTISQKP